MTETIMEQLDRILLQLKDLEKDVEELKLIRTDFPRYLKEQAEKRYDIHN